MIDSPKLEEILMSAGAETYKHSENVRIITEILLQNKVLRNNYSEQQIADIIFAAKYHDIGKSLIDKDILYSSGKLTNEQMQYIQTHSKKGMELVENELVQDVLDDTESAVAREQILKNICLYHHKRQNGEGYPPLEDGIDKAPEYTEIVGIADVMEALTAKRSYKEPMNIDVAYDLIMSGKCGYYTDKMKAIFSESFPNIKKFIEEKREKETGISHFVTLKKKEQEILQNSEEKDMHKNEMGQENER